AERSGEDVADDEVSVLVGDERCALRSECVVRPPQLAHPIFRERNRSAGGVFDRPFDRRLLAKNENEIAYWSAAGRRGAVDVAGAIDPVLRDLRDDVESLIRRDAAE